MLNFWETRMKNKMVSLYFFAPFLEEAGTLLLGAQQLWHPWSIKRRNELSKTAHELKDEAKTLRQRGLAWGSNALEPGGATTHLLSTSIYYRYHGRQRNDAAISHPEAAPYMVSTATNLLFALLPEFQKVAKIFYEEDHWTEWLSEIIEKITEAPYYNPAHKIPDATMRIVGTHGILTECEGLAYTQATIEDSFNKHKECPRRKKKSDLSEAELRKLASEIGMPLETVKETFETEFSSWWNRAEEYSNRARAQRKIFLSTLSSEDRVKEAIRTVWNPGMTTQCGSQEYLDEAMLKKSETVITTFISMFLAFAEHNESRHSVTALQKSPKKMLR